MTAHRDYMRDYMREYRKTPGTYSYNEIHGIGRAGEVMRNRSRRNRRAQGVAERGSPEHRAAWRAKMVGVVRERSDGAGYAGAHHRLYTDRGPASEYACVDCGEPAREWSFNNDTPVKRTKYRSDGRPFSLNTVDYNPRCASCHKRYDLACVVLRAP